MFRTVVAVVAALALAASANAQTLMLKVAKVENKQVMMTETVTVIQQVTVQEKVKTNDGKEAVVTKVVNVPVQKQVQSAIPLANVKATTLDGKAIPDDKLAELMRTERAVVVVYGPGGDLEKFRKALKDDTVVLTIEGPIAVPAGVPGAAPAVIPGPGAAPALIPGPGAPPVPVPSTVPPVKVPVKPN